MPAFEYRSLDHRGKIRKGTLEADSARQVRQQLRDKGWVPIEVNEAQDSAPKAGLGRFSSSGKLSGAEQALVTRQLATLLKSGLPVEQALSATRQSWPTLTEARDAFEQKYLFKLLKMTDGNVTRAAELAGRNRTDMHKLMKKHILDAGDFR